MRHAKKSSPMKLAFRFSERPIESRSVFSTKQNKWVLGKSITYRLEKKRSLTSTWAYIRMICELQRIFGRFPLPEVGKSKFWGSVINNCASLNFQVSRFSLGRGGGGRGDDAILTSMQALSLSAH